MAEFNLANGDVSAYGLACGYLDEKRRQLQNGDSVVITLSFNGCTYDVDVTPPGNAPREWITTSSGRHIISGWAQFDRLGDARKFQRRLAKAPHIRTTGDMFAHCLVEMLEEA